MTGEVFALRADRIQLGDAARCAKVLVAQASTPAGFARPSGRFNRIANGLTGMTDRLRLKHPLTDRSFASLAILDRRFAFSEFVLAGFGIVGMTRGPLA